MNNYVMGLRPLQIFLPDSEGIYFTRQNLMPVLLTTEVDPRAVRG